MVALQRFSKVVVSPIKEELESIRSLAAVMAFYQSTLIEFSVAVLDATLFIAVVCSASKADKRVVRSKTGGRLSIVYLTISYLPSLIEVF